MMAKLTSGRFWLAIMAGIALVIIVHALCKSMVGPEVNRLADTATGAVLIIIKDVFAAYFNKGPEA